MNRKIYIILILISASHLLLAQKETFKWQAKKTNYADSTITHTDLVQPNIVDYFQRGYKFFISDLDGDNCAFSPSCSQFFVSAVKKTNLLEGTLLFADRFTRDLNIFKNSNGYKIGINGKFLDPVKIYVGNDTILNSFNIYQHE